MNAQLSAYPWPWNVIAYSILGIGWLSVVWFLTRYMSTRPWASTEAGRHLVTMSSCVGGFFTLYLVLAVWPNLPGKGAIRIGLLVFLVAACVWRAWMLERVDRADRLRVRGEDPRS